MREMRYSNYSPHKGSDPYSSPPNFKHTFEQEDENLISGRKRNIFKDCLFLLPLIAFVIICFFASCLLITSKRNDNLNFSEQQAVLGYLEKNYKSNLWEECKAVTKADSCPAEHEVEPIGSFSGLKEGCLCNDGTVHNQAYCQTKAETKCKWYAGLNGKDFILWKTRKLCVKKITDWKILKKEEVCNGAGYSKCGDYCVKSTKCPITKIELVTRQAGVFAQLSFVERANFDVNKDILITRGTDNRGVINFDTKVTDFPCAASGIKNPQPGSGKSYPLETIPNKGCGKYGDLAATSEKLDQNLDQVFLQENEVWDSLTTAPFIEDFRNSKDYFGLFTIHKIDTKNEKICYEVDSESSKKIEEGYKQLHNNLYIYCVCLIVVSCIGIILSLVFIMMRRQLKFLNNRAVLFLIFLLLLIVAVVSIIMFIHYKHKLKNSNINSTIVHFENLSNNGCFKLNNFKNAADDMIASSKKVSHELGWLVWTIFLTAVIALGLYVFATLIRAVSSLSMLPDPKI